MHAHRLTIAALGLGVFLLGLTQGCSCGSTGDTGFGGSGAASGTSTAHGGNNSGGGALVGPGATSTGSGHACKNLECQQVTCTGGAKTTVSGTVYEPAGKTPLYNIAVYVPNAPLSDFTDGASCDKCSSALSGDPVVTTLTDTAGHFSLEDVPVGKDIPLVIQVGKWRRELTIPKVDKCVDTPLTDINQTRLPKNQGEGHIPKIALSTGGADPLECFLPKIGLDLAEFTPESGTGRVNLFTGSGGASRYDASLNGGADFSDAQTVLWPDKPSLMKYDIVLLACEGAQNPGTKPAPSLQAMADYAGAGGRVFASHWHNYWLEAGPSSFPTVANFDPGMGNDPPDPFTLTIDQTFPKGVAFAQWLVNVGASTTPGSIDVHEARHTVDSVNNPPAQQWIYGSDASENPAELSEYLTFNTPIGVPDKQQCGRVVFSDLHVSSGDAIGAPFPNGCQTMDLSAQEKALLFMLFDLSACISNDKNPTCPPGFDACGTGQPACPSGETCGANGCCRNIPH